MQTDVHIFALITGIAGGLALFLFGMDVMTAALRQVAGERMKRILATLTTNRFRAALAGAFITAVIQSSSVTTVLLVGFISAGLLTLKQSLGIIIGANVGTTITAQIIAFKVTHYALLMIAIGFILSFFIKRKSVIGYGRMLLGLGLVFLGMNLMSEATAPLRSYQPFIDSMVRLDNRFLALLVGAVFTAVIQSSSAFTGIVIVLAGQGFLSLEAGIALVFGANIGTCVTALLATIGKQREAVQAAVAHVLINILGVLLWIGWIENFADLVRWVSPAAEVTEALSEHQRRILEVPRQIANAHTVFNVCNTLVFIWFTGPLAKLIERLLPAGPREESIQPQFLDPVYLETPDIALQRVRLEEARICAQLNRTLRIAFRMVAHGTEDELRAVARMDDDLDLLYRAVLNYLGQLAERDLTTKQSESLHDLMAVANYLENAGDTIENNVVRIGLHRPETAHTYPGAGLACMQPLLDRVTLSLELLETCLNTMPK